MNKKIVYLVINNKTGELTACSKRLGAANAMGLGRNTFNKRIKQGDFTVDRLNMSVKVLHLQ